MLDQPPPSRFSVIERGGRLVVIDRQSGRTPPTAAERMAEHDRLLGLEPVRPDMPEPVSQQLVVPPPPARTVAAPPVSSPPAGASRREADPARRRPIAPAPDERGSQPWGGGQRRSDGRRPMPARIPDRPVARADRKSFTTAKWWDAKGPRTVELGPKGQAELSGGFIAFFFMAVAIALVTAFVALPLLFAGAFVVVRFADKIIAPIGASLIDKAVAERG